MSLIIRPIQAAEYKLLKEFLYHAAFTPYSAFQLSQENVSKSEISIYTNDFGKKGDYGVVAVDDGQIIGMAWTRLISAFCHVDGKKPELVISVLPEHRRRGVGTSLLIYLFELLHRHGYQQTLLYVQKTNPAVQLFQRMGYRILRENIADFIMVKELGVNLREWKKEDAADLATAINSKKIQDNLRDGIPYPYTEKDADEFIDRMLTAEKDTQYTFAITYNNKAIGSIGAFRKDNVHRLTAELGYYIAEAYWGKGIITTAIRQICAFVFEHTDILRIFAEPLATNHASCRALEKAGFRVEGTLRQNAIKNGQVLDMTLYALLKNPAVRQLNVPDASAAMDLVWRVFSEFEAPSYSDEGILEFKTFINSDSIAEKISNGKLLIWGAFEDAKLVGVIAVRQPLHISLLFVDKQYHRRGIARKLLETALNATTHANAHERVTVHASPYAVEIYQRLGFVTVDTTRTMHGIRFTPMELLLKQ